MYRLISSLPAATALTLILILVVRTAAAISIPTTVPAPIAAYDFDDCTVIDVTGGGHDGAAFGPVCEPTPYGQGFVLDGVDDYVRVTDGLEDFGFSDQSLTVSIWTKFIDNVDDWRTVLVIGNYSDSVEGHTVSISKSRSGVHEGRIGFSLTRSDGWSDSSAFSNLTGAQLPKNHWLHLVGVVDWDAGTVALYIDGKLQNTASIIPDHFDLAMYGPADVVLGDWNGVDSFHNSSLDEFAVWDTALTADQIADLYAAGRNPVRAWWTFEDGAGNVLHDVSHNGNDGDVFGAGWVGAEDHGALAFDGIDDLVAVPMTPRYEIDDSFTWEVVARFNPSGLAIQTMLGLERTDNGEVKISHWDGASPESDVFASSRTDSYTEGTGINMLFGDSEYVDTGWHAYALVRDVALGEYRFYVDRVLADTCPFNDAQAINNTLVPLAIGAQTHNDYVDQYFAGEIAEARISDVVLGVDELLETIVPEAAVAAFTQDVDSGPVPLTVHFSSTSTGTITGYVWNFGDGATSDEADPAHTFVVEGIYTVTLTVTNSGGSDTATDTIYVLESAPQIIAIRDVPEDQGRWVYVDFMRSMYDTDGLTLSEMYTVQREDDGQWVSLTSPGAYGELMYTAVVPTQGDGDPWLTSFRVIAHMDEGNWASATVVGSSADNITPPTPQDVYWVTYINLAWSAVDAPDLVGYRIYGSNNSTFSDDAELVADVPGPEYEFAIPHEWAYYFVTAVDDAGLESDPSEPRIPLSAENGIPNAFALGNFPNPFNPQTTIVCVLPKGGATRLGVYDVVGRLVRVLVDENRPQGRFEVDWDGRDDHGQAVASGTYIYRLESAKQVLSRRMMLVR